MRRVKHFKINTTRTPAFTFGDQFKIRTGIAKQLVEGEDVKISGFGNFQIRTKAPRPGRNPRTGEAVQVDDKKVPFFKTGKELRERLNLPKA